MGVPTGLPDGTYVVAWRVLSGDSHPIRGAYAFSVGEPTEDGQGLIERVLDREAESESVDAALAVTRFVGLALILLCVGGVGFLTLAADPAGAPRLVALDRTRRGRNPARARLGCLDRADGREGGRARVVRRVQLVALPGDPGDGLRPCVGRPRTSGGRASHSRRGGLEARARSLDPAPCSRRLHRGNAGTVRPRTCRRAARDAGGRSPCDRGRRLGGRPGVPRTRSRRSRQRALVARGTRRSAVLVARARLRDRARRDRDRRRAQPARLLAGVVGDDLRAIVAREGRPARPARRPGSFQQQGVGAAPAVGGRRSADAAALRTLRRRRARR